MISDLSVGPAVADGALQEFARTLQIQEPVLCCMKPLAKYTVMDSTYRGGLPYLQAAKFLQQIHEELYAKFGHALIAEVFRYANFIRNVDPHKLLARSLCRPSGVRTLPYVAKGIYIKIFGNSRYNAYFLGRSRSVPLDQSAVK